MSGPPIHLAPLGSLLDRGLGLIDGGDLRGGLELLLQAYTANQGDPATALAVAEACVRIGDRPTAAAILQAYLRLVPGDGQAAQRAARLLGIPEPATEAPATPPSKRILFVALAHSTHTHSWVSLLEAQGFDVRVFGVQGHAPPESFKVPTTLYCPAHPGAGYDPAAERRQLAQLIQHWRPDVVHSLGIDPASYIYFLAREEFGLQGIGRWVMTCRGGSDIFLRRFTDQKRHLSALLQACDVFVADNHDSYAFALELGLPRERLSETGPVPGTGGVDVEALRRFAAVPPSKRERIVLWPKAYECEWSKALPVYEALKLCWERIKPCRVVMTAMVGDEAAAWFPLLPEEIRQSCVSFDRLPRNDLFRLMAGARVMLAPSLVDGVPNSLYEAMAMGTMPIVSPLGSITKAVDDENVLYARNLFPDEIAEALVRAMNDDALVDRTAQLNLPAVRRIADVAAVRGRVLPLYRRLAAGGGG